MPQYREGSVNLISDSAIVIGNSTRWNTDGNVKPGYLFNATGSNTTYEIESVNSDTQLTLSRPYKGTSENEAGYSITRDFTPRHNLPYIQAGDDVSAILSKLIRQLDAILPEQGQGTNPIITTGEPGEVIYPHWAWAEDDKGTGFSTTPTANSLYIGLANTNSPTPPTNSFLYAWTRIANVILPDGSADNTTQSIRHTFITTFEEAQTVSGQDWLSQGNGLSTNSFFTVPRDCVISNISVTTSAEFDGSETNFPSLVLNVHSRVTGTEVITTENITLTHEGTASDPTRFMNVSADSILGDESASPPINPLAIHASDRIGIQWGTNGGVPAVVTVEFTWFESILAVALSSPELLTGSGADSFLDLDDTPAVFGAATQIIRVNATRNGLEFVDLPSQITKLIQLTDTPNDFGSAQSGQVLAVNPGTDGFIFATLSFTHLQDTPSSLGTSKQMIRVNESGDEIEFFTLERTVINVPGGPGDSVPDYLPIAIDSNTGHVWSPQRQVIQSTSAQATWNAYIHSDYRGTHNSPPGNPAEGDYYYNTIHHYFERYTHAQGSLFRWIHASVSVVLGSNAIFLGEFSTQQEATDAIGNINLTGTTFAVFNRAIDGYGLYRLDNSTYVPGNNTQVLQRYHRLSTADELNSESTARQAQDVAIAELVSDEVLARQTADTTERTERIAADTMEQTARTEADQVERAERIAGDKRIPVTTQVEHEFEEDEDDATHAIVTFENGHTTRVFRLSEELKKLRTHDDAGDIIVTVHTTAQYASGSAEPFDSVLSIDAIRATTTSLLPGEVGNVGEVSEAGIAASTASNGIVSAFRFTLPDMIDMFRLNFTLVGNNNVVISDVIVEFKEQFSVSDETESASSFTDLNDTPESLGTEDQFVVVSSEGSLSFASLSGRDNWVTLHKTENGFEIRVSTATENLAGVVTVASETQAKALSLHTRSMTPLRTKQAIQSFLDSKVTAPVRLYYKKSVAQPQPPDISGNTITFHGTPPIINNDQIGTSSNLWYSTSASAPNVTNGKLWAVHITTIKFDGIDTQFSVGAVAQYVDELPTIPIPATEEQVTDGTDNVAYITSLRLKESLSDLLATINTSLANLGTAVLDPDDLPDEADASRVFPLSERAVVRALGNVPSGVTGGNGDVSFVLLDEANYDFTSTTGGWFATAASNPDNDIDIRNYPDEFAIRIETGDYRIVNKSDIMNITSSVGVNLLTLIPQRNDLVKILTTAADSSDVSVYSFAWDADNNRLLVAIGQNNPVYDAMPLRTYKIVSAGISSGGGGGGVEFIGEDAVVTYVNDDRWHETDIVWPAIGDINVNDMFYLDFGDTETQGNLQLSDAPSFTGRSVRALTNNTAGSTYDFNGTAIHVSFNVVFTGGGSEVQAAIGKNSSNKLLIAVESSSGSLQAAPLRLLRIRAAGTGTETSTSTPPTGQNIQQQPVNDEPVVWINQFGDAIKIVTGTQYSNIAVNEINNGVKAYRWMGETVLYDYPALNEHRLQFENGEQAIGFDFGGNGNRWPDRFIMGFKLYLTALPESICDIVWGDKDIASSNGGWALTLDNSGRLYLQFGSSNSIRLSASAPDALQVNVEYRIALGFEKQSNGNWSVYHNINNQQRANSILNYTNDVKTQVIIGRSERNGTGYFEGFIYDFVITETQRAMSHTITDGIGATSSRIAPLNYLGRAALLRNDSFVSGTGFQRHYNFNALDALLNQDGSGATQYDVRDGFGRLPGGVFIRAIPTQPTGLQRSDVSIQIVDMDGVSRLLGSQGDNGIFVPAGALNNGILKVFVRWESGTSLQSLTLEMQPYGIQSISTEGPRQHLWVKSASIAPWFGHPGHINTFEGNVGDIYVDDIDYAIVFGQAGHADSKTQIIPGDRLKSPLTMSQSQSRSGRKAHDFYVGGWTLDDAKVGLGTIDNFSVSSSLAASFGRFVRGNNSPPNTIKAFHWYESISGVRRINAILFVGKPWRFLNRNVE